MIFHRKGNLVIIDLKNNIKKNLLILLLHLFCFKKEQNKIYQSIPIFWDKRCGKQTLMPIFFFCKFFDLKGMIKDLWK
mgnify:FL=1